MGLLVHPFAQNFLLGPHLQHEFIDTIGQADQALIVLRAAPDDALLNFFGEVRDAPLRVQHRKT